MSDVGNGNDKTLTYCPMSVLWNRSVWDRDGILSLREKEIYYNLKYNSFNL
jgi:hypothetical protein